MGNIKMIILKDLSNTDVNCVQWSWNMHTDAISVDEAYMHGYTMKYIMHKTVQTISITY